MPVLSGLSPDQKKRERVMFNFPNYKLIKIKMPSRVDWDLPAYIAPPGTLEEINEYINEAVKYTADSGDYWQSPRLTLRRKRGDCEDYCVAKYAMLRNAGFEDMAVIVGKDGDGEHHALLFVREIKMVGEHTPHAGPSESILVLDNRTPIIHMASYYHKFFTPMYAVNHEAAWFYSPETEQP